jgi:hypothetical protein
LFATDGIPDVDDRCPMLPGECIEGFVDSDGCPDGELAIDFAHDSTELGREALGLLDAIAHDSSRMKRGARLVVIGGRASGERHGLGRLRGQLVVDALVKRCVPIARVQRIGTEVQGARVEIRALCGL